MLVQLPGVIFCGPAYFALPGLGLRFTTRGIGGWPRTRAQYHLSTKGGNREKRELLQILAAMGSDLILDVIDEALDGGQ